MLDLYHWYARLHGPRAFRVNQTAITDEAARRTDEASSAGQDWEEDAGAAYDTSTVLPPTRTSRR